MSKNISDVFADEITKHSVNLVRVEEGIAREGKRVLIQMEKELISKLKDIAPTAPAREPYRVRRMEKLLEQVQETIHSSYSNFKGVVTSELIDVAEYESEIFPRLFNNAIKADIVTTGLTRSAFKNIVKTELIQGEVAGEWFGRLAATTRQRVQDQLKIGILAGETTGDLVRRIRGRAVPGAPRGTYAGGVMATTTREATAFIRTAVHEVAQRTRLDVINENSAVIKGIQALATLDTNTTDLCMSRAGRAWDLKTGAPLKGTNTTISFPGAPPWHWQCRTNLIPITKTWEELGAKTRSKIPEPEKMQASMNGQVAGELNYEQWLKTQPKGVQIKALGKGKYKLWKEGKIKSFRQLVDQSGRPLTIKEIQGTHAAKRVIKKSAVSTTAKTSAKTVSTVSKEQLENTFKKYIQNYAAFPWSEETLTRVTPGLTDITKATNGNKAFFNEMPYLIEAGPSAVKRVFPKNNVAGVYTRAEGAAANTGKIHITDRAKGGYTEVFTHEYGHFVADTYIERHKGIYSVVTREYEAALESVEKRIKTKVTAKNINKVLPYEGPSGYGLSSIDEWLAECFRIYVSGNEVQKKRLAEYGPKTMNVIKNILEKGGTK